MVMVPASLAGRDVFYITLPATLWLANIQCPFGTTRTTNKTPLGFFKR